VAYADDGEPQGLVEIALRSDYVNGTDSSPVGFLEGIYVAPQFRRQGVAGKLIETAQQWAREQGCSEMASDAVLDNTTSHAMHLALGFEETERVVYFRKSL
jgi:aminoglycoside 6'-N-acetyltransferase I